MITLQWQDGQEGDRLARAAGVGQGALPDAAVESALIGRAIAAMRKASALVASVVATGLTLGLPPSVQAQAPLRIGASLSQTGPYAPLALNQLRGYQLCVKHANDKGGVLGRRIDCSWRTTCRSPRWRPASTRS
jgi:ABC-type branched-subunit amino acid transport system substrate-binding protein